MAGITKDHRTKDTAEPLCWVVATDKFMSGWGQAPGKSYVAYPVYSHEDERELTRYAQDRPEFIRVRVNLNLPRVKDGDHLSLYDRPHARDAEQRAADLRKAIGKAIGFDRVVIEYKDGSTVTGCMSYAADCKTPILKKRLLDPCGTLLEMDGIRKISVPPALVLYPARD